jgi:hypothetical protein
MKEFAPYQPLLMPLKYGNAFGFTNDIFFMNG